MAAEIEVFENRFRNGEVSKAKAKETVDKNNVVLRINK